MIVANTPRWRPRPLRMDGCIWQASASENVGTGQFCVYGLLAKKDAPQLAAPSAVSATVVDKRLTLTWAAVPGAQVYRVFRKSTFEPEPKVIAMGLTTPAYSEPAPERGESMSYAVIAVAANGRAGAMSSAAKITSPKPKEMEN